MTDNGSSEDLVVPTTRAGYVALIGFPNAGKSSLLNALLEEKLSIVTPAAQTTRAKVVGIDTRGDVQVIFVDTPGLVEPKYLLHEAMLQTAVQTIGEVDAVVLVVDAAQAAPELPDPVLTALRRATSVIVAANKIDVASEARVAEVASWARETIGAEVVEVSATTGAGLDALRAAVGARLPMSPFLYPADEVSSQSVRFFVSELLREAVFELYQQEIPYSFAAVIDEFREERDPLFIRATLYLERDSQKAILIGKKGAGIRSLGELARTKIESFLQTRVYLDLWVKVLPRWRKDPVALRRLGFDPPTSKPSR